MADRRKLSYTVNEACDAAGIKRTTFYKLRKEGVLRTFTFGGRTLIYDDELRAALDTASGRAAAGAQGDDVPRPLGV